MYHWLHHLLNPHCDACASDKLEDKVCQSCETLKTQLAIANNEKQQILNSLLSLTAKPEEQVSPAVDFKQLKPTMMTWNVRKRMLEEEDRAAAKLLAEQRKKDKESEKTSPLTPGERGYMEESIKNLERELGVEEEVKTNA